MNINEARQLAQTIALDDYADDWKQPKAFLHDAITDIIILAVAPFEEVVRLMAQAGDQLLSERNSARAALADAMEATTVREAEIGREGWPADGLARAAAIVLHELEHDGQIQPHSRALLQSAVQAYETGKRGGNDDR